jgi:mRNA interferase RelE/StbE
MYSVEITSKALKQLSKIDTRDRRRIAERIEYLKENPYPEGYKKLRGCDDLMRIRQGDYRIIYQVDQGKLVILVVTIGHRRDIYRR